MTLLAYTDDAMGNMIVKLVTGVFAGFGITPNTLSFPATASDLSSLRDSGCHHEPRLNFVPLQRIQQSGVLYF